MQLRLKRSQRTGGVLGNTAIFCLDAQAWFTPDENANIRRYKLHNQCIYNSESSLRAQENMKANLAKGTVGGSLKALGHVAIHRMRLNITINSLARGQHIECKSLDELLGAEDALYEACQNLKGYLDTAATFDGREVVIDFAQPEQPQIVAHAQPQQVLVATPTPAAAIAAPMALAQTVEAVISAPMAEAAFEPEPQVTSAYAPSYGEVGSGIFSEGPEGERQKLIAIVVGAVVLVLFIIVVA